MTVFSTYLVLFLAAAFEVAGTSALLASHQFSRLGPSAAVFACYAISLVLISLTVRTIPVGVVFALWSGMGMGMVMVAAVGWLGFGQRLDQPTMLGIALILAGVAVLNLFSSSASEGG